MQKLMRIIRPILIFLASMLLFPVTALLYMSGYRRFCTFTDRIGHLALEPDMLLKAQALGLIQPHKWIIIAPPNHVANQHLLEYWKKYYLVVQSLLLCLILRLLTSWKFMQFDASRFINRDEGAHEAYEISAKWGSDRAPFLSLSREDEVYGEIKLSEMGLPKGSWFVCIHAREGGFSPSDEHLHSYRNGRIENLQLAVDEIISRGGWVIRVGDPTSVPINTQPHVIDYAHHPLREARLDIILCAKAKFILGNTSGIFLVGSAFGTPSLLVNMIPFAALGVYSKDISIPKLLKSKESNSYLPFLRIMGSELATYRYSYLYEQSKILVEENSAEDILAATIEMLERLDGSFSHTIEDKMLYMKFMALFTKHHFAYGASSNIGRDFLRKYSYLLRDETTFS